MNAKGKAATLCGVCASVLTVALLVGCAAQSGGAASAGAESADQAASTEMPSAQELVAMFPNEYLSSLTSKLDETQKDNSHGDMQASIQLPGKRTGGGTIKEVVDWNDPDKTEISISCIACKSTAFNDFYAKMGDEAFVKTNALSADDMNALDGKFYDCASCHTYEDGTMVLSANLPYANKDIFTTLASYYDSLNPEEAVCGQCHNVANARNFAKWDVSAADFNPYEYGTDLDGVYKALVEGGIYDVDEKTGILMLKENHPQVEVFQGSIHQSMGLSCVSCHMNKTTDESGGEYTSHASSSSVAADDEAMELCLTCHKSQDGVQDVEQMREFLKVRQDVQAQRNVEVKASLDEFYGEIVAAIESGAIDEASLQQAKDKYSVANWYLWEQMGNVNDAIDGAQIAHNPTYLPDLLERASVLIEDGRALLA